jgi:hypothetical protein
MWDQELLDPFPIIWQLLTDQNFSGFILDCYDIVI